MITSNCRAYLRHDSTASTKQIRLNESYWSLIEKVQKQLAEELNVPRVSRPVALAYILDQVREAGLLEEGFVYDPEAYTEELEEEAA